MCLLYGPRDYQVNVLPGQVLQFTVLRFRKSTYGYLNHNENCAIIAVEITEDAVKSKAENTEFKTVLYTMMLSTLPL